MARGIFVTGTDTGVGKTYVSCKLLEYYKQQGDIVLGLKPVASGCNQTAVGLRNEDALMLQNAANFKLDYDCINPMAFEPFIAPHIAADKIEVKLTVTDIVKACKPGLASPVDRIIAEGAGGWLTPISRTETMADLAISIGFPVIMVVSIKLGCLNQALLTANAIKQSGVELIAWVPNLIEQGQECVEENIQALECLLSKICAKMEL